MTEEQTLKAYFAALKAKRYKVAAALAESLRRFNIEAGAREHRSRVSLMCDKIQQECKP